MLDREFSEVKSEWINLLTPFLWMNIVLVSMSSDEPFATIPTMERSHKSIFIKFCSQIFKARNKKYPTSLTTWYSVNCIWFQLMMEEMEVSNESVVAAGDNRGPLPQAPGGDRAPAGRGTYSCWVWNLSLFLSHSLSLSLSLFLCLSLSIYLFQMYLSISYTQNI